MNYKNREQYKHLMRVLAVAAIVGIVVNAILPGKDYNFQNDYEYGKTTEDHGQML